MYGLRMSRTRHKLQSEDWYGSWAGYFHRENREMRQRGREKRRHVETLDIEEGCTCTNIRLDVYCIMHGLDND